MAMPNASHNAKRITSAKFWVVVLLWAGAFVSNLGVQFLCSHRKCALPVHLEINKTPTKLLFVNPKAILCINVWCGDKENILLLPSCTVVWKYLCSWTYSVITGILQTGQGLFYLYVEGWQCQTPTHHTDEILGCFTPVGQTMERLLIRDAKSLIWRHRNGKQKCLNINNFLKNGYSRWCGVFDHDLVHTQVFPLTVSQFFPTLNIWRIRVIEHSLRIKVTFLNPSGYHVRYFCGRKTCAWC